MSGRSSRCTPPRRVLYAWILLLLFLSATVALAYVPLSWGNTVVALAIATLKAGIVALVFMELGSDRPLARIFAAAGVFWLAIMFWLVFNDYATRAGFPPASGVQENEQKRH